MEAKLNKVDLEIRQEINRKTEDHKIHKKDENVIGNNLNEKKDIQQNMEQYNTGKDCRIIVEAEKDLDECSKGISKGLLFDKIT